MDPVTLIVAALVAGTANGVGSVAATAVSDAYKSFKSLIAARLQGDPEGLAALEQHPDMPDPAPEPLARALTTSGATQDEAILAAAVRLLELADPDGSVAKKYRIDLRDAKGVQLGDHNIQHNTF